MRKSVSTGETFSDVVDKDPFYKTNDMLQGAFNKKIRLLSGETSMTDCDGSIWVNFSPKRFSEVSHQEDVQNDHPIYRLKCGHLFRGAKDKMHTVGKTIPCFRCGMEDAYYSLEHEWSHIIFRSDPHLWTEFVKHYMGKLKKDGYEVDKIPGLGDFLFMLINAFDDIRSNSLWEKVFPGAADRLWKKWKRLSEQDRDINENFASLVFGVALDADNVNTQEGDYVELLPVIVKATEGVRGKGTVNMLKIVRWVLEKSVNTLLSNYYASAPTPPQQQGGQQAGAQQQPQPGQGQDQQQQGGQQDGDSSQVDDSQGSPGQSAGDQQSSDPGDGSGESSSGGSDSSKDDSAGDAQGQSSQGQQGPGDSAQSQGGSGTDSSQGQPSSGGADDQGEKSKTDALNYLVQGSSRLDEEQDHHIPGDKDRDPNSTANWAAISKILSDDDLDSDEDLQSSLEHGESEDAQIDDDMQQQVTRLQDALRPKNTNHFLLADAKSKILLVDVMPDDVKGGVPIEVSPEDQNKIDRMHAAFARVLGRRRNRMEDAGLNVDPQSAIQRLMDPSEVEIFEEEILNKGFYYLILADMSGSMHGKRFRQVCLANEMLKAALDYPFVDGSLWGFRGAYDSSSSGSGYGYRSAFRGGEIWVYRYHKNCHGYVSQKRKVKGVYSSGGTYSVPVECGGLTPMNSAIHLASKYMVTQVPAGMIKRIFLLTDGFPTHVTTKGRQMSKNMLIDFVANEVNISRQKGVQIYTFVLDDDISDSAALKMFGAERYWERINNDNNIGQGLMNVALKEFVKFLRSR